MSVQDDRGVRTSPQGLASGQPPGKSNPRRRMRKTTSCEACRRNKLRCDRQAPCGSCRRRNRVVSCTYGRKDAATQQALQSPDGGHHSDLGMSDLLSPLGPGSEVPVRDACGVEQGHNDYTTSQWDALLERPVDQMGDPTAHGSLLQLGTHFPFHLHLDQSLKELLTVLPTTHCCDYLITQYFVRLSPMFHILHGPTFQKQYKDFLQNPLKVDLSWLALLFAICSVSVHTLEEDDAVLKDLWLRQPQPHAQDRAVISNQLRASAMVCLSQDNFLVHHRLCTLEALLVMIYTISNYEGVERGWALLGKL
jgi:hypothetical protein